MRKKALRLIGTTTNLGNWLNRKLVLYLDDLANPKNELNLTANLLYYQNGVFYLNI